MLSRAELMDLAVLVKCTDSGVVVHNSKCSYMWRPLNNTEYNPEGQEWVLYYMGVTRNEGKITVQHAKLGLCYIYGTDIMVFGGEFDQCKVFGTFANSC